MSEKIFEVKSFRVYYICDECGEGEMELIARLKTSLIQYEHRCNKCGYKLISRKRYPDIVYREVK